MRISLTLTNHSIPEGFADLPTALARVTRAADEGGLDGVWVPDHLLQTDPRSTPDAPMLEAYTTLGFLAAQTRQVGLGTMVSAATYRPPALLVKAVTTLDVLSGGRARLGIGAGYAEHEARAMGLPLPPVPERFDRLEEVLRIARHMWSGDTTAFHGRHYRLEGPVTSPLPVQRPRPPILVGGTGERRTLPLVARYADACNLFDVPDGGRTVRHKLEVLARHCDAVGRPFAEIEKTLSTRLGRDETVAEFAARAERLRELGIEHLVVLTDDPWTEKAVATLAAARLVLAGSAAD